MKRRAFLSALLLSQLAGCSTISELAIPQASISSDEARVDFYAQQWENEEEFVRLMCWNQRPSDDIRVRDLSAGEHTLFVIATVKNSGVRQINRREAVVRLDAALEGGKRYSLAQARDGDSMKVWLQESETGLLASQVVDVEVSVPRLVGNTRLEQCKEGTV
ncbi:hypothetical protein [Alteromonas sp. PRIM-21]|uniref:hypothetical protein n=1 Tax=Alteromonas sp. PRIM-21 TaxID=1454978 RepID=UPI0022B99594|nr:hypothetical protein [Alteromonas sp. PRIM-21]MCZ8528138.1 hypothetical protein [Alteromonas sp. PRIM-21]